MQLLICILNDEKRLNDALAALVEAGVKGATIVESYGMAKVLARDVPIFAGFRNLLQGARPYNHTLFSVIHDESILDTVLALLRDVLEADTYGSGNLVFTVPVSRFERIGGQAKEGEAGRA